MNTKRPLLQAALNGDRVHPAAPHTAQEIAAQAAAAVAAGAQSVHVHVFDDVGRQTLAAGPAARLLRAVPASCPGIPISLSTSADVEPDPASRCRAVESWTAPPDLVTANQGEVGIVESPRLSVSPLGANRPSAHGPSQGARPARLDQARTDRNRPALSCPSGLPRANSLCKTGASSLPKTSTSGQESAPVGER